MNNSEILTNSIYYQNRANSYLALLISVFFSLLQTLDLNSNRILHRNRQEWKRTKKEFSISR